MGSSVQKELPPGQQTQVADRMKATLLVFSFLFGIAISSFLPGDYEDMKRLISEYPEIQEVYNNLMYHRGRRVPSERVPSEVGPALSRVYRGRPLFLSNHADAVMRGLG